MLESGKLATPYEACIYMKVMEGKGRVQQLFCMTTVRHHRQDFMESSYR